eukprot:995943-Pyramimonas_sp.AAC.1
MSHKRSPRLNLGPRSPYFILRAPRCATSGHLRALFVTPFQARAIFELQTSKRMPHKGISPLQPRSPNLSCPPLRDERSSCHLGALAMLPGEARSLAQAATTDHLRALEAVHVNR